MRTEPQFSHGPGRVARAVLRLLVLPAVVVAATGAWLVGSTMLAAPDVPSSPPTGAASQWERIPWRAAYSELFPECVATVLWPRHVQPAAALVVRPSGRLTKIDPAAAVAAAEGGSGVVPIGLCRRR